MANKQKDHILVWHTGRIIFYLALYLLNGMLFLFFRHYFFLFLGILMTAAPILSFAAAKLVLHSLEAEVSFPNRYEKKENEVSARFVITSIPGISMLNLTAVCQIGNQFYQTNSSFSLTIPLEIARTQTMTVPLKTEQNGILFLSIDFIQVMDFLGFYVGKKKLSSQAEVILLPPDKTWLETEQKGLANEANSFLENRLNGSDDLEVSDIREYRPGDRLRDIHWKLSAKQNTLLIKERTKASKEQSVIVIDLFGRHDQVDMVIDLAWQTEIYMLSQEFQTIFVWWNKHQGKWEHVFVSAKEEISETFCLFYRSQTTSSGPAPLPPKRIGNTELHSYTHIGLHDGIVKAVTIKRNV